jgi:hypothetical protein
MSVIRRGGLASGQPANHLDSARSPEWTAQQADQNRNDQQQAGKRYCDQECADEHQKNECGNRPDRECEHGKAKRAHSGNVNPTGIIESAPLRTDAWIAGRNDFRLGARSLYSSIRLLCHGGLAAPFAAM